MGDFNAVTDRGDVQPEDRWMHARRWPRRVKREKSGRLVDWVRTLQPHHRIPHTRRRRWGQYHSSYLDRIYVTPDVTQSLATSPRAAVPHQWLGRELRSAHDPRYVTFTTFPMSQVDGNTITSVDLPQQTAVQMTLDSWCHGTQKPVHARPCTIPPRERLRQLCMESHNISTLKKLEMTI